VFFDLALFGIFWSFNIRAEVLHFQGRAGKARHSRRNPRRQPSFRFRLRQGFGGQAGAASKRRAPNMTF
jgi:hypothetical protein